MRLNKYEVYFWGPNHHSITEKSILESTASKWVSVIENAQTIGAVRRAARASYADGLRATPCQGQIQDAVIERKRELRQQRPGFDDGLNKSHKDMSW